VDEIRLESTSTGKHSQTPHCTSLAWSADGSDLFAGFSDNVVRVYSI